MIPPLGGAFLRVSEIVPKIQCSFIISLGGVVKNVQHQVFGQKQNSDIHPETTPEMRGDTVYNHSHEQK